MKPLKAIIFSILILSFVSCGISHPPFDYETPDTQNNVFHYEHLVNVEITDDVKNLYSYGSEGIDASYYLAFECDEDTKEKIIKANKMDKDIEVGQALYSSFEIDWWNKEEIDTLSRYVYSSDDERYFRYFWYNDDSHQAYFLDFDL